MIDLREGNQLMIGYNVYRNNERLCIAGIGDFGVLTACVTWVGHTPEKLARWTAEGISAEEPVQFDLGGWRLEKR
jgi:hypothetical protein